MYKHLFLLIFIGISLFSCTNKNAKYINSHMNESENVAPIADSLAIYLLVGTYTTGESEGIYVYKFDTISGNSEYVSMVEVVNPSYLALSKDEKFVYAVTETGDNTAVANAFSFDKKEGKLTFLNSQFTGGADPCYIVVDDVGKHAVTANYSGGSITPFGINADGTLSEALSVINFTGRGTTERQQSPHLHSVIFTPDRKYLFANDLGTDCIHKFNVNENEPGNFLQLGTPASFKVADGSGPRHMEFHPNGKFAYLINELSGAVIVFNYAGGNLKEIQSIQADTLGAKGSADIHVSPDGKYVYASNRLKGDGIAVFAVNQADGKLTKVGYQETGAHPRNFAITPNGKYLLVASRDTDMIQVFEIDKKTGLLTDMHKDIQLSMPVCLKFASIQ